jgi:mRNA interferase YafQ
MSFEIYFDKTFDRHFNNLKTLFKLSDTGSKKLKLDILDSIELLSENGQLPPEYQDHILVQSPWTGFNEYHVWSDILVVYAQVGIKQERNF